jgi:hypothetical protein
MAAVVVTAEVVAMVSAAYVVAVTVAGLVVVDDVALAVSGAFAVVLANGVDDTYAA